MPTKQFIQMKLPALRRTAFVIELLIKTRVESVEVLSIEHVGNEPKIFAEMINLSKCFQSPC